MPEEFAKAELLIGNYGQLQDNGSVIRPYEAYAVYIN